MPKNGIFWHKINYALFGIYKFGIFLAYKKFGEIWHGIIWHQKRPSQFFLSFFKLLFNIKGFSKFQYIYDKNI